MKKLMDMMDKKKVSMSEEEMQAKLDVLAELMDLAKESRMGQLGEGLKKVTVAAPDKEGLVKGLEKAEDIVEGEEMMDEESEESEDESEPSIMDMLKKKKEDKDEEEM